MLCFLETSLTMILLSCRVVSCRDVWCHVISYVDECSQGQHNCHVSATCQNTIGSFTCICPPDKVSDGTTCHGFPFHWTFNGPDQLLTLKGAARFTEQDGRTVLFLDGTAGTFAETPALPFRQTDFTIAAWIKRPPSPSSRQMIYGDWSSPHQFRFDIMTDNRLCVDVRRDSSVEPGLVNFCTPFSKTVPADVWSHIAFTWSRVQRTGSLYINGVSLRNKTANISVETSLDLKNSGHTVYDVGLKRDSGNTIVAFLSDLMVFNRVLSINEIVNELFSSHPLHSFTYSI
ncbi:Signal peptide, CUB and EGF-like domain-containing protein 1 [Stylophora pistillata]|uniref:Signal peptide, CUB and EGF-like domain-containing protein 1 n=1 Tax=Stylophora pistillata TaxID=50429 RepID=A0A2B4SN89_STYPI|nr:Signal peptide, CUB and EGF-like domain-containing protein 1 [Stylophora pistillata]